MEFALKNSAMQTVCHALKRLSLAIMLCFAGLISASATAQVPDTELPDTPIPGTQQGAAAKPDNPDRQPVTQTEQTAAKLLRVTVTLRIAPLKAESPSSAADKQKQTPSSVTVCSGTLLAKGQILSILPSDVATGRSGLPKATFRVTLPDGEQATAQPVVIDHYSNLILLQVAGKQPAGLSVAKSLPRIGGTVLTAAAAGIEDPLVSRGVLSGTNRTIRGTNLPPLIQCDLSTTASSSGAAVVNAEGELLGIIVATSTYSERFGWTYAVPIRYIQRVLKARTPDQVAILVRRRPSVGLTLVAGRDPGTVVVERVQPGGPAEKAGIRKGDIIHKADSRKIRSAYQAVALILKRQPGEKISLVVDRAGKQQPIDVTLGGSAALLANIPANQDAKVAVGPQLNLRVSGQKIEVQNRQGIAELSTDGNTTGPVRSPGNEVENLRAQLEAFQNVIVALQRERLKSREREQQQRKQLDALQQEIDRMRGELKKQSPK